jgi:hypothetical protein
LQRLPQDGAEHGARDWYEEKRRNKVRGELMFQLLNLPRSEKERARLETNLARTGRD